MPPKLRYLRSHRQISTQYILQALQNSALLTSEALGIPKSLQTQAPGADVSLSKDAAEGGLIPQQGLTGAALLSGSVTGAVTRCDRAASAS